MGGQEFWVGHLEAIEAMGLSTKEYAERKGLNVQALYAWRAKLKRQRRERAASETGADASAGNFVRVVSATTEARKDLCIEAGFCSLRFAQLPDPAWLGALLQVLREA